jgi:hypothetical protein
MGDHLSRLAIAGAAAGLLLALLLGARTSLAQSPAPLAPNDVSILFPLPRAGDDLSSFISIADLANRSGAAPLPLIAGSFQRFSEIAQGPGSKVSGTPQQITFRDEIKDIKSWLVAGVRLDVGAPGLSGAIIEQFGQIPQIRLIAQPVTGEGDSLKVHDFAAHFIFSFASRDAGAPEGCLKFAPNLPAFRAAVDDFVALRDGLAEGRFGGQAVSTAGPLNVHPGLTGASRKQVRDAIVALLEKHLSPFQLGSMAIMGLPAGKREPWIFVPMQNTAAGPVAVPNPSLDGKMTAQMLSFLDDARVLPEPHSNNLADAMTSCFVGLDKRKGVSTAKLLVEEAAGTDGPEFQKLVSELTAVIADPAKSHFFNTDCISCHTETRLLRTHVPDEPIPGIAAEVLPSKNWNVRNFGWGPEAAGFRPTITRRTATETDEVVKAVNTLLK